MAKDYTKIIFNGGVSTEPEVNELIAQIGVPQPGDQISYNRITEIIKAPRRTSRWASVVTAWRKKLERDHNIVFSAVPNEGFQAMNNSERVNYGCKKFDLGFKAIERGIVVIQKTDRAGLSDDEKKAADYVVNIGATVRGIERTSSRKQILPEIDRAVATNGNGVAA